MIASRLNPWWKLIATHESADGDRCVDLFSRPDKSFGFAEFSRSDDGHWTPVGDFKNLEYSKSDKALEAAKERVEWLGGVLEAPAEAEDTPPSAPDDALEDRPNPLADTPRSAPTTSMQSRRARPPRGAGRAPGQER